VLDGWEQIAQVRADFPSLQVNLGEKKPWYIAWRGKIVSFEQEYDISILWPRWSPWDGFDLETHSPRVYVNDPPLAPRADGEKVPHLYRRSGERPYLCLYDPQERTWTAARPVAETIIPWAAQWLRTYELWQVTGKWLAPGRHPEVGDWDSSSSEREKGRRNDQSAPYSARANALIGRLTETSASLPLMVAASGGYSPSLSWPVWKESTLAELQSQLASTSSRARPLAA
jgi:hypothetical protein